MKRMPFRQKKKYKVQLLGLLCFLWLHNNSKKMMLIRFPASLIVLMVLITQSWALAADYKIEGELKQWHRVTLTFEGPDSSEQATPNPFLDYRLQVKFTNNKKTYSVPGYYAADGVADESSANSGNKWRVHFMPDSTGAWSFTASFRKGTHIAVSDNPEAGSPTHFDGTKGSFQVGASNKSAPDNRAKGRLDYVKQRYLQFQGNGEYYLKAGPDSPENLLAFEDFDETFSHNPQKQFLKDWAPHRQDWIEGDPAWQNGKGKALIGAINYISSQGMNVIYFLTMNILGDGQDVWPYCRL